MKRTKIFFFGINSLKKLKEDKSFSSVSSVFFSGNSQIILPDQDGILYDPSSPANDPTVEKSDQICPWFLRGGCRFRKNCRLSHDIGGKCPYCGDDLPDTWTQQSKHLKRCWENRIEAQELELSLSLSCEVCGTSQVSSFALQQNCQHVICSHCWKTSKASPPRRRECLLCGTQSEAIIERDRLYFEPDRKSKAFGLFVKKRNMAKLRTRVYQDQAPLQQEQQSVNHHLQHNDSSKYY